MTGLNGSRLYFLPPIPIFCLFFYHKTVLHKIWKVLDAIKSLIPSNKVIILFISFVLLSPVFEFGFRLIINLFLDILLLMLVVKNQFITCVR